MVNNGTKVKIVQANTAGLSNSIKYGNEAIIVDVSGSGIYVGNNTENPIKLTASAVHSHLKSDIEDIADINACFVDTDGTVDEPETPAYKLYVDTVVGDIGSILDEINGEEI